MRRSVTSSIVILSLLMLTTFAVLVGTSLVGHAQRAQSSTGKLCSMKINAYIKEVNDSGEEVILNFEDHPELNKSAWGLYDKRRSNSVPISFNQNSLAQYQVFTTDRAFVPFPQDHEVYDAAEKAFVSLAYENDKYNLVRKEIKVCSKDNESAWLCSNTAVGNAQNESAAIETISDLHTDCGMNLEFGWVMQPRQAGFADNSPSKTVGKAINKAADINNDHAYNTLDLLAVINAYGNQGESLSADINNDRSVNALDYTLVVEAIESQ